MGESERADLDWLYRRDPETVAKDTAKAEREGRAYERPRIPRARTAPSRDVAAAAERPLTPRGNPVADARQAVAAPPAGAGRPAEDAPPAHIEAAPPREPATPRPVPADAPVRQPLPGARPLPGERGPATGGATARPDRPRRRPHWFRLGLVALLMALLVLGAYLVLTPLGAWNRIARVDDAPPGARPAEHPGTAILLVGSDSRGQLTPEEMAQLEVGQEAGDEGETARTDTILVLYTPPKGRPLLLSIPRDSWVEIPGQGEAKINAAFALGGPELLIQTIEQEFRFRIDGYAEIGMAGFVRVVQALDGLDICVPQAVEGEMAHDPIPAGCQTLSPKQSLWYVRARHNDPQGDIGRAARQRQFISAVMKQSMSPAVVLNPAKYNAVNDAVAKGVALGKDTTIGDAMALATGMRAVSGGKGVSMAMPVADPAAWSDDGQSIVELDWDACAQLFGQLNRGDTTNVERFQR